MQLKKPRKPWRVAVLVPCYKRPEYTRKCLVSLFKAQKYKNTDFFIVDDGSNDATEIILRLFKTDHTRFSFRKESVGLRQNIIDFFKWTHGKYDILAKVDNDCKVPKNWLNNILYIFEHSDVDILSPAVTPSEAELRYGKHDSEGNGYLPAKTIGGLWIMKAEMIDGMEFDQHDLYGIKGAIPLLWQIQVEKEPKMGWARDVVFEDMGHWSGKHPDNIKTEQHELYYREVGRRIAWEREEVCHSV